MGQTLPEPCPVSVRDPALPVTASVSVATATARDHARHRRRHPARLSRGPGWHPAGKGRERIAFSTRRYGDHTLVVPADAQREDLRLIVETKAKRLPRIAGVRPVRVLSAIGGTAITVARTGAAWRALTSSSSTIEKVWLDGVREPLLDQSVPQIGAPAAWDAGYTDRGVKVAVLDGGVDASER